MYRLLRDTHLLLGLFFFLFVMMFGVSSVRFAHHGWFAGGPAESESTLPVHPAKADTPRALARHLMEDGGLRGELHGVEEDGPAVRFSISRIGTVHDVRYERGAAEAEVKTRVFPFMDKMTWLHATFGVQHEYGPHNVWGVLMFLTSVGLLALGGTGLYLWFRMRSERRAGSIVLAANLVLGAVLIALIWAG